MAVSSDPVCWINIESMLSQRCVPALGCHSFGVSPVPVLNYPDLDLQSMRGSRKFCQSGPTLTRFYLFFKLMRREMIQIPLLADHQRPASETPFRLAGRWWPNIECWIGSIVILRGSGPVLLRKEPYIFVIFQGGGGGVRTPCPPSGSAHAKDQIW